MNTKPNFHLRLSPEKELAHLVSLTAGLLASNRFVPSADNQVELPLARDIAHQLFEQLRWDVERRVEEFPENYDIANQMPTS